jgi:glucose-1-phosphate adenylyltransferase
MVLAGGRGERLKPLTSVRSKPSVPFGGAYRIIDFTLSNCIHSGLRRIFLLTQYQARSLEDHIRFGRNFLPRRLEQFISVMPPHHGSGEEKWYRGTADALTQNIDQIEEAQPKHVIVLAGDHIYKMDYSRMLREHLIHRAALTIGAVQIPINEASRFGVFQVDSRNRVLDFQEKPTNPKPMPADPNTCLASMGIYVFETDELLRRLRADDAKGAASTHDFGKDVIPAMISEVPVYVHNFQSPDGAAPYWRDVGTIDAYYDANFDLLDVTPPLNLYDWNWPIYTLWHNDPPAKTVFDEPGGRRAEVVDSLLCPGVVVSGASIRRSILSNRVFVDEHARVEDSIVFGNVRIGKGARIRRAIVDKWVQVPDGFELGYDREKDRQRFTVTDSGITVVSNRQQLSA